VSSPPVALASPDRATSAASDARIIYDWLIDPGAPRAVFVVAVLEVAGTAGYARHRPAPRRAGLGPGGRASRCRAHGAIVEGRRTSPPQPTTLQEEDHAMPDKTYKLIELVGVSPDSVQQAVRNAITRASESLKGIDWFEVTEIRGTVSSGQVSEFQVKLKVGFRILSEQELKGA